MLRRALFLAGLVAISSCAKQIFETKKVDEGAYGLVYHLPKSLVEVTLRAYGLPAGAKVARLSSREIAALTANPSGAVISRVFVDGRPRKVLVKADGTLISSLVTELRFEVKEKAERIADPKFAYTLEYKPSKFSAVTKASRG